MKRMILLALLSLAGTSVMAQLKVLQKPVELGIHGGWSYSKIYTENHHTRTHWGYAAGVFGRVNFSKMYLEPAIDYVHKEVLIERAINDTKFRTSSVDVPVLVGVSFLNFPLIKVRAFAGPVASFLVQRGEFGDNVVDPVNPPLVVSDKTMFYLRAGLGVDVWRATLDINHEVGLKTYGESLSRPQTTNITLGFKIF